MMDFADIIVKRIWKDIIKLKKILLNQNIIFCCCLQHVGTVECNLIYVFET